MRSGHSDNLKLTVSSNMTYHRSKSIKFTVPGIIPGMYTRVENFGDILEFCLPQLPKVFQGEVLGPRGSRPGWISRWWKLDLSSGEGSVAFLPFEKAQHVLLGMSTELGYT